MSELSKMGYRPYLNLGIQNSAALPKGYDGDAYKDWTEDDEMMKIKLFKSMTLQQQLWSIFIDIRKSH